MWAASGEDCSDLNNLALAVLLGCASEVDAAAEAVVPGAVCSFPGESGLLDNWRFVLVDAGRPPELETGDVGAGGAFLACACIALSCSKVLPRSSLGIRLGSTLGALSSVYWRSGMGKPAALAASIAFSSAFCFRANSACTFQSRSQRTHIPCSDMSSRLVDYLGSSNGKLHRSQVRFC